MIKNLARMKSNEFGSCNGGWAYDAYPELETLDAGYKHDQLMPLNERIKPILHKNG